MDKKRFKYCYHEIPFSDKEATKQRPYTLVGIIDASGSMGKLWKLLVAQWNGLLEENRHNQTFTITFDTKARCNMLDPALRTLLNKHGGGGTTLDEPFLKFQEIWREQIPPQNEIKVVFISDGQDNELATLQNRLEKLRPVVPGQIVTFMCLGILSEFPTFVSMKLRDIYHTGDPTCPSVPVQAGDPWPRQHRRPRRRDHREVPRALPRLRDHGRGDVRRARPPPRARHLPRQPASGRRADLGDQPRRPQ